MVRSHAAEAAPPIGPLGDERDAPSTLNNSSQMDRFTRNYLIVLTAALVAAILLWVSMSWKPRVWELNAILESDAELASYPYPFRVLSLEDGVAILSTPRNFEVPAIRFLAVISPELANKPQDHPDMIAAQERLIHYQKRAQALIDEQPDITAVRWELDRDWYAKRGISLAVPGS